MSAHPLVAAAVSTLRKASQTPPPPNDRQVRQPDSWLVRHSWQALAISGAPEATFSVLALVGEGEPFSLYRALPLLADRAPGDVGLAVALAEKLRTLGFLPALPFGGDRESWAEQLLAVAYSAARIDDTSTAFACLERLDQQPGIWSTVFARTELRERLAQTVVWAGPHPLTLQLLRNALRLHDEPGSHFLLSVGTAAARHIREDRRISASRRLLRRCVDTFQHAAITSLISRRHAAVLFGLAGQPERILEQLTIIANVQEARRMSNIYTLRDAEQQVIRQVRRPRANADADFQIYTLKEAVEALPLEKISPSQRQALADKIAELGGSSDGWSAAAAAGALVRLGAGSQAAAINERIDPGDHSRSEAHRVLVEALLRDGDETAAASQSAMGLRWARSLTEHHPERLTIWGIVEAYLAQGKAQQALSVLGQRRPPSFSVRLRQLFGERPGAEALREEALRMHAALLQEEGGEDQAVVHLSRLRRWAPDLLEGKALALFYTENVLEPLLTVRHDRVFWAFLPDLRRALGGIAGREFPTRVEDVCEKLVRRLGQRRAESSADADGELPQASGRLQEEEAVLADFLAQLWEQSAAQGIWQTVYAVGGALPLIIALAGPAAVQAIAQFAATEGIRWRRVVEIEAETAEEGDLPANHLKRET
ncbi:MAG: hypothetical protein KJZ86_23835 [Caldilineaceae bacterium]|nr:hypothetical protein [Caldilineaceae bacterium]